ARSVISVNHWHVVTHDQPGPNRAGKTTMRRHGAKNADYRGGVTCLYDTQLLGDCLHASESGGRSRPEAVRGMPDVPIAPPATGPPRGGRLSALSAQPLSTGGCGRVCLETLT